MHSIEAALLQNINLISGEHSPVESQSSRSSVIVAYSGGLDSSVLLHAVWRLFKQQLIMQPTAAHVNHGLQRQADDWQLHCQNTCDSYQIPLLIKSLQLSEQGKMSEQHARDARYLFFEEMIKPGQQIVFAHHRDDQAETILFRLFRGTGIHGMRGIPSSRPLGSGQVIRPLLDFSRKELQDYATQNELSWIEDPSNQRSEYDRNFIRNDVIPLLQSKWPSVSKSLLQFSQIASDQVEILEDVSKQDLKNIETDIETINISTLVQLSAARQKNLLHFWIRKRSLYSPSMIEIDELIRQISPPESSSREQDKALKIKMSCGWVRSFDNQLFYCHTEEPVVIAKIVTWQKVRQKLELELELELENGIILSTERIEETLPSERLGSLQLRLPFEHEVVTVRPRAGGEKANPTYRQHSTELKKIYQELKVPVWKREWLPIIYYNEQLVAVPGVFIEKSVQVDKGGLIFNITQKTE